MKLTYRFIRTATLKIAADAPAALQFAGEVCAYLNKKYALNIQCGMELFDKARVHWYADADSMDRLTAVFADTLQDREYVAMLEKTRPLWVEGTLKDSIVAMVG